MAKPNLRLVADPHTVRDSIREGEELEQRRRMKQILNRPYMKIGAFIIALALASHNADLRSWSHVALFLIGAVGLYFTLVWMREPRRRTRPFYQGRV